MYRYSKCKKQLSIYLIHTDTSVCVLVFTVAVSLFDISNLNLLFFLDNLSFALHSMGEMIFSDEHITKHANHSLSFSYRLYFGLPNSRSRN